MTDSKSLARRTKALLGSTLAIGFLLGPLCEAAPKEKTWPKRDFLPPVATINPRIDEKQAVGENKVDDGEIEEVALNAVATSATIRLKPKVERLAGSIAAQADSEHIKTVMEIQKRVDEADLEYLWRATVEKNPVIRFSLEKLATPVDLESKHSSQFLTKTLSTLISGASLASTFLPGGSNVYQNMGSMAVGNALQNMVTGRVKPTTGSLSATEQIQLAGLIDELKAKLIRSYQDYKQTLESLAQCRVTTVKNNALYSKALASKNDVAIMTTGIAYYQSLMNETALKQKAKLYRLELERLAGPESVSNLELVAHISNPTAQTAVNTGPMPINKPLDVDQDALPYTVPDLIGPHPLIGPEPQYKKSNIPKELPEVMEIKPSLKNQDNRLPSPLPKNPTIRVHRKALAEQKAALHGELKPIEVLHP